MSNIGDLLQQEVKARPPHVEFFREAVENKQASEKEGRYVAVDVDFAKLTPPGGGGNGVKWKIGACRDYYRKEIQNGRMPVQWLENFDAMYERWKNGQEIPVNGTPILGWMVISPAQQKMLIARGIATLEDLAALNAEGVQRIGMGGIELKNNAINAIQAAKDVGPLVMKNANLESEMAILKANYASLEKKFSEAIQALNSPVPGQTQHQAAPSAEGISASDILGDDDDLGDLRDQYEQKFGQPPHHRMKRETIERALRE